MFNEREIATTRIKKIQKLTNLSKHWIKSIGFFGFLKLAIYELHNQGLDLFKSDKVSEIQKILYEEHFENYIQWMTNNSINENEYPRIIEEIDDFEFKPTFHLIFLEYEQGFVERSTESLKNPLYSNWDYHILNKTKKPFTQRESKAIIESSLEKLSKNLGFDEEDYLIFLCPGDKFHDDSFYHLCKHLEKNRQELVYFDHDFLKNNTRTEPFFKPEWSPNLFLSMNYIDRAFAIKFSLFQKLQEPFSIYDLLLKATEKTEKISHLSIPIISLEKDKTIRNEKDIEALQSAIDRKKINGTIVPQENSNFFRLKYNLEEKPKVSIIIPTKDNVKLLKRCLTSLERKTAYKNFEVIIVDNNSVKEETLNYYKSISHKIITNKDHFNFSTLINTGAAVASGKFLLLLNDDVAIIDSNWLNELVSICNQSNIGAVGPKLVFKNKTIQHAGVIFLKTGAGFHPYHAYPAHHLGYYGFMNVIRDYSAVTGACLLTRKELFEKLDGFDEIFDLYYGDSDYCLKIRELGYEVVYTPHATLIHDGSSKTKEIAKEPHFAVENHYHFIERWANLKNGDPYYNPNLGWNYSLIIG